MTPEERARVEWLAKRLAVAWWSAEGILSNDPRAKSAAWFSAEYVDLCWEKLRDTKRYTGGSRAFFSAMAEMLAHVLIADRAQALRAAVEKARSDLKVVPDMPLVEAHRFVLGYEAACDAIAAILEERKDG